MTITAQNSSDGPITCTIGQTVFGFTFDVEVESHVKVVHALATTNAETEWTYITHYTVDLVAKTITYNDTAPGGQVDNGDQVVVYRVTPSTQPIEFESHGPWFPQNHEDAADNGVKLAQEADEKHSRSVVAPRTQPLAVPNQILNDQSMSTPQTRWDIYLGDLAGYTRGRIEITNLLWADHTNGISLRAHLRAFGSPLPTTGAGGYTTQLRLYGEGGVKTDEEIDWWWFQQETDSLSLIRPATCHMIFDVVNMGTLTGWSMNGHIELKDFYTAQLKSEALIGNWKYNDVDNVDVPDFLAIETQNSNFTAGRAVIIGVY